MPLQVLHANGNLPVARPVEVTPADLQPALDRLHNAFKQGYIDAQDIAKRQQVGTSDAQAQRAKNDAAKQKSIQDQLDQTGGTVRQRGPLGFLNPKPKPAGAGPAAAPAATTESPINFGGSPAAVPAVPSTPGGGTPGPMTDKASQGDFNPSQWSTADLSSLVSEHGFEVGGGGDSGGMGPGGSDQL